IVSEGMVGGKVVEINPGSTDREAVAEDALLKSEKSTELTDVLDSVGSTLQGVREGEGTVQKLLKEREADDALVSAIKQIDQTAASAEQKLDAVKNLPLVGGYVPPSATDLLVRPKYECNRWVFAEADLFEPGRAVLTGPGRKALDEKAPKMKFHQNG